MALRITVAWGAFALGALVAPSAFGFCRTTTCLTCPFDPDTQCPTGGRAIFWPRSCVSYSLNLAASSQVDLATATEFADRAFATWNAVRCDGSSLGIQASNMGPVACGHVEYNPTQANANVILFREGEWPYTGAGNTLALTTVTFDKSTGEIQDADMEINGTNRFQLGGGKGGIDDYDLLSIMTHEAGHFLGLAHSRQFDAVMQISLSPHVVRTTLSADDVGGICAVYPPASTKTTCDSTPQGGFSPQCGLDPTTGGACSVVPSASHDHAALPIELIAAAAAASWLVRRRRRR